MPATAAIQLIRQPRRNLAVVNFRASAPEIGARIGAAFTTVASFLSRNGVEISGPAIARYTMRGDSFDVSAGFTVAAPITAEGAVVPDVLPECDAAVMTHLGGYDSLGPAYESLREWIIDNGGTPSETMWDEYYSGPSTPPAQTRTRIIWPVNRGRAGGDAAC